MDRRSFFLKTLKATAAGILVPEYLIKGRSMVSLCGIDLIPGVVTQQLLYLMRLENEWRRDCLDSIMYMREVEKAFDTPKGMMK